MTRTLPLLADVKADAAISPDGRYRYLLTRQWYPIGNQGSVLFVMLNPSVADSDVDDMTLRRCQGFARAWGYSGVGVVNLFALRATNPQDLKVVADPVGPANDDIIQTCFESSSYGMVIAAWGVYGCWRHRDAIVLDLARGAGRNLHVLKYTSRGVPRHPLYVAGDETPILYREYR